MSSECPTSHKYLQFSQRYFFIESKYARWKFTMMHLLINCSNVYVTSKRYERLSEQVIAGWVSFWLHILHNSRAMFEE